MKANVNYVRNCPALPYAPPEILFEITEITRFSSKSEIKKIAIIIITGIYHYCANFASEDYAQKKKIQTHQFTVQSYNHLVCF